MRYVVIMLLAVTSSLSINAQTIFSHEREIKDKTNFVFTEVNFLNASDHLRLSGTLITPISDYDKVVIILSNLKMCDQSTA